MGKRTAMAKRSQAEQDIARRMEAHQDDPKRSDVLGRAARFKRSWVELAEGLNEVRDQDRWTRWGFGSFLEYCKKELHLRRATADKLTASYGYLTQYAPDVLRRDGVQAPIPQADTVQALARAREDKELPDQMFSAIQADALESDLSPATLARRFKEALAGQGEGKGEGEGEGPKQVDRVVRLARRLADILPDLAPRVPDELAADVEEQLGRLIRFLDEKRAAGKRPAQSRPAQKRPAQKRPAGKPPKRS